MTRVEIQHILETALQETSEIQDECDQLRVLALGTRDNLSILLGRVRHQHDDATAAATMIGGARAMAYVLGGAIDRHAGIVEESADGRLRDVMSGLRSVAEDGGRS
jgi:hypothetical protein